MCGPILFSVLAFMAIELLVLVEVGGAVGGFNTVLMVVFGGVIGLSIAQNQGFETVRRLQNQPVVPNSADMLEGPLLIGAALSLLLPGFVSDGLGALLLVPPIRRFVARRIVARFGGGPGPDGSGRSEDDETIIVVKRRR